jgi:hypothetical protein
MMFTKFMVLPRTQNLEKIQVLVSKEAADRLRLQVAVSRRHLGQVISRLAEKHLPPLPKQNT